MTPIFGGATTATYSYIIPVANHRLFHGETKFYGITLQEYSTECLDSLELTIKVKLISRAVNWLEFPPSYLLVGFYSQLVEKSPEA